MNTAVLFADISGFTALGEACAKKGVRGNEELAFCINRYMEGLVKNLGKYGGDIIKFVGDALIVMWPEERSHQADKHSFIVRKAIQCALDIQKEMNNFLVLNEVSPLSVKIGIGYGQCALLYVGGVFNRAEFFTVGSALTYALKSEGQAEKGGEIIVSDTAFKYVSEYYKAEPRPDKSTGEKFFVIDCLTGQGVKSKSEALAIRAGIKDETYLKIENALRGCMPAAIIPYLQIGAEKFGSETRSLTVMFASLGVELSSAETREGMEKIQKIFVCVQQQVYRHQGSLNKLVMDDKGSTLICLWGLSPMAHDDDAARAILTAFNIRRELSKIDGTTCNIGISSGEMFVGVVGTSGSRKEFSVLGDVANLAARIMYWPIKNKEVGKINVDLNSRNLAANTFQFKYGGHQEFKGKSISIPIFEAIEPSEELKDITKDLLPPGAFLKPHSNPLTVSMQSAGLSDKQKITGLAADVVKSLKSEITKYFNTFSQVPYMASIKGELGSGKTLFVKSLLAELYESEDLKRMMRPRNKFFCSSLNAETQYSFLNIWRPILTQLTTWQCKRDKIQREFVLQKVLMEAPGGLPANSKYTQILAQIFGVNDMLTYSLINSTQAQQVQPDFRQNPFVQPEKFAEKDNIVRLCLHFLKNICVQQPGGWFGQGSPPQQMVQAVPDQNPILIVLDNTHMMDGPSWQLFAAIRDECSRIGVIIIQQCDDTGELIIAPEARQDFNRVWFAKNMDTLRQYELPSLNAKSLESLLVQFASQYKELSLAQVQAITHIQNESKTIKDKKKSDEWREFYIEQWQLLVEYKAISPLVIDIILQQCAGNPLLSLNFFISLLHNKFIFIKQSGEVVPLKKLRECQSLGQFIDVPVPRIAIKKNLAMIDRFLSSVSFKVKRRPEELQNCVKAIVMMKAASVIGDQFDMRSLMAVNPLRQSEDLRSLAVLVKLLESHGFIEIVNETDQDNLVCRFNKPFLRESIYQVTLFRDQKISIHGATAQFLLKNQTAENLLSVDLLKRHLLVSEDTQDEEKLSLKSRTGLQITRIQNILEKDPKALVLKEFIYKQGEKVNKKTSKRLATVDTHYLKWYHNEKELESFTPLGRIPISQIYETVNAKLQWLTRPSFSIKTTMWFDKQDQEQGSRQFFFAGESDIQIEKWMITIDYLRTRAIYDQYAQQSQSITFLSLKPKNERKPESNPHRDKQSLLYDFGKQVQNKIEGQQHFGVSRRRSPRLEQNGTIASSELANKLRVLYGCGIVSFAHHLARTAAKVTVSKQNAHLGQLPDRVETRVKDRVEQVISEDYEKSISGKLSVRSQFSQHPGQQDYDSKFGKQKDYVQDDMIETSNRRAFRRESTISADQVSKAKELAQINKKIQEVSSGSPPISHNNPAPKIVQPPKDVLRRNSVKVGKVASPLPQTLQPPHSSTDFAPEKMSAHTTPQLSITQTVIEHERAALDGNRQTFAPSDDGGLALFNQDERLDHLRSQSPPMHQPRATHEKHTSITDSKKQSEHSGASDLHNNSLLLNSLQKLIQKSIADGVQSLVQQNEKNLKSQKEELTNVIVQTHSQLLSAYDSPKSGQPSRHSFMDLSVKSVGVTSHKPGQRGLYSETQKPQSKRLRHDDDQEPSDPNSKSPVDRARGLMYQSRVDDRFDAQSERTLKRGEYQSHSFKAGYEQQYSHFEEPTRNIVPEKQKRIIAQCVSDSRCQKDPSFKVRQGQFVEVVEKLPSYKLFKVESQQRQGLFLMSDFKLIESFSKLQQTQTPPKQYEKVIMTNQRILAEESDNIKAQNLKMLDRLKQKKRRQLM